jgi:hypothetical protein
MDFGPRLASMKTGSDQGNSAIHRSGVAAKIALSVAIMLLAREARADSPVVATLVPKHVFLARGFSVRGGDYFSIEPAFLFVANTKPGGRPIVGVARPMAGVGGSGVGVGLALQPIGPIESERPEGVEDYVSILPISLEVHVERMYKPTNWHSATYLGPQLSLSVFVLKASAGLMFNADDQRDRHAQLGIGCGF